MCVSFHLRQAECGHLLSHHSQGHVVQGQAGCRALHRKAGDRRELHELLRCVPGTGRRAELPSAEHNDDNDDYDDYDVDDDADLQHVGGAGVRGHVPEWSGLRAERLQFLLVLFARRLRPLLPVVRRNLSDGLRVHGDDPFIMRVCFSR